MNSILKTLPAVLLLAASTLAHANTLTGSVGVSAPVINAFTPNGPLPTTAISFNPNDFTVGPGIGDLRGVSLTYIPGAFTFTTNTPFAPELLLTLTAGATSGFTGSASFFVSEVLLNSNTGTYNFEGALSGASFTTTSADMSFSPLNVTANGGTPITTDGEYSARIFTSPAATPEPSSVVLLGTGLMSAAGMVLRKRRVIR